MDSIPMVLQITDRLFSKTLDQKTVRSICLETEELLPDTKKSVVAEIVSRIRFLLVQDPLRALKTVTFLCDGCSTLHQSLGLCLEEIVFACTTRLQTHHTEECRKQSQYHIAAKALYSILQHNLPQVFLHEKSQVTKLFEKVYFSLLMALKSDKLPSDSALIISTSLCITLSYLKQDNMKANLLHMLFTLNEIEPCEIEKGNECSSEQTSECQPDRIKHWKENGDELIKNFKHIKPSYAVLLVLHGLFNSGVQWIYYDGGWNDIKRGSKTKLVQKVTKEVDVDNNASSKQSDGLPLTQIQKEGNDDREDVNIFLYEVYPLIKKLCKGATSYTFQAFQVLHMWLTCVRKLGKKMQDGLFDMRENQTSGLCQEFLKNYHPTRQFMFTFQSANYDTVFHLLNSNWENPAKGASDTVYTCMVELLELHEDGQPGCAKLLAKDMLAAVFSSAAWGSKSTYPPLALAVSYVGAEEALKIHPMLPSGLVTSLGVNHLAPAGATVYKIILGQLSSSLWFQYFSTVICEALHSDNRLIRQHVLSLWLPPTLRQYPSMYLELLSGCQNTSNGWVALMAVLRIARSIGAFSLEKYSRVHGQMMKGTIEAQVSFTDNKIISNIDEYREMKEAGFSSPLSNDDDGRMKKTVTLIPIFSFIHSALSHVNETVRGEVLSLLCHTQKASQPVLFEESDFLKFFFKWNMNIDSAPFRQMVIKSYKALVIRLRDACASELKDSSFKVLTSGKCSTEFMKTFKATPTLEINIELLVWFVKLFHSNLAPDGNYQRRILSLQLYKETLLAFYEKKDDSTYSMNQRCMTVCRYMNLISCNSVSFVDSDKDRQPLRDLTLPWTLEMLLSSCLDEMNDIREEAELTLKILESSKSTLSFSEAKKWLHRGLILCNSPRASDAESGAALVKVMSSLCYWSDHDISSLLKNLEMGSKSQSLLHFLSGCVEAQFKAAQKNLLEAARCTPIYGSLIALGCCLSENMGVASLSSEDIQDFVQRLIVLIVEIVEFMLSKLACASPNGSAIAPSFAEMGEAVELIIKECGGSEEESSKTTTELFTFGDMEEGDVDIDDDTAISADYLLVSACCWQTMKTCCVVSSICITCWLNCLHENQIENLLRAVVVRVLTGTRHKGAMEAAKTAYSQICFVLLTTNSSISQLVYRQVEDVLDQLKDGVQTSVTRRAAGMAMMLQVACGAAPRANTGLINNTIIKLMNIAQAEYEEQSNMDSPPVLALHVLHSLVIHAPLAHHLIHHMPAITATCLHAFTNKSWALRNAALQLYGAVVPRMVGQKKVQDDSSTLNSLTAPEFLSRHPVLADFLLKLLSNSGDEKEVHVRLMHTIDREERVGHAEKKLSINMSSSLVPVLSLVARLSPGTELQQSKELQDTLHNFCLVTTTFLGSPVHTVRRLASLAVVALTPIEQAPFCINNLLQMFGAPKLVTTNLIHGNLLTLMNFVQAYPQLRDDMDLKKKIATSLVGFLGKEIKCYINASLAQKILMFLQLDNITPYMMPIDLSEPGAAEYKQTITKMRIKHSTQDETEKFLMSEISEISDREDLCIDHILDNLKICRNSSWIGKIERLLWQRLEQEPLTLRNTSVSMKLLCKLLEENDSLRFAPSEKCMKNLLSILQGHYGVRVTLLALVVVAHLFHKLHENQWPGRVMRSDFLSIFADAISSYSSPTSTEDYRLSASIALKISIRALIYSEQDISLTCKEKIILACIELLQDEDSHIRNSACYIVLSVASIDQHFEAVPESIIEKIHFEKLRLDSLSKDALHPNLALLEYATVITRKCISTSDWSTFRVLWKICSNQYGQDFSAAHEISNSRTYLFQSHTMNLYKEPKQLSLILAKAMKETLQQVPINVDKSDVPTWLQEESAILNRQGEILTRLISQHQYLSNQKQLLSAVSTYIVAYDTMLSLTNIFNVSVNLSFPLFWNSSSFCAIDTVTES